MPCVVVVTMVYRWAGGARRTASYPPVSETSIIEKLSLFVLLQQLIGVLLYDNIDSNNVMKRRKKKEERIWSCHHLHMSTRYNYVHHRRPGQSFSVFINSCSGLQPQPHIIIHLYYITFKRFLVHCKTTMETATVTIINYINVKITLYPAQYNGCGEC